MIKFFISKACYLSPWGWENNGMTIRTMLVPTQCPRDKLYSWVYCTLVHRVQDSRGWVSSTTRWSSMTLCQWGINNNKIWVSANWSIVLTPSLQAINRRRPKVWTFCSDLVTDCKVMWGSQRSEDRMGGCCRKDKDKAEEEPRVEGDRWY